MKGTIFEIKHFAVHDGPGIRTTVFLKGCPLKCLWCHNPEGISTKKQLEFIRHKCTNCGRCAAVCPTKAHALNAEHQHIFDRKKCINCGKCVSACFSGALSLYGKEATTNEVMRNLLSDKDFYESGSGGITLSGGECLMQAAFCAELLQKCKQNGLHTAVDTCGMVPRAALDSVIPYTDLFLYDIKAIDEDVHIACTGQSNKLILENLRYLNEKKKAVEIRIPFVPHYNDSQIEKIGAFLQNLTNITGVRVLPYHNYAGTKYNSLDMENTLPDTLPTEAETKKARDTLQAFGITVLS